MNNRLKIQKIIRSVILQCLSDLGYDGWNVQEFASPQFVSLNKAILMNLIRTERLGWQHDNLEDGVRDVVRKDKWLELEHWQIHVIAKRPLEADENTIVAEDVTEDLVAYLNGPGMDMFRSNGIAPERIDEKTILVYNDDNEIFQKRGVFTVKIEVPKELTTAGVEAEAVKPKTMPI